MAQSNSVRAGVVFVENVGTGKFKRLNPNKQQKSRPTHTVEEDENGTPIEEDDIPRLFVYSVAAIISTFFIFCQGLLGGVALIHFYFTNIAADDIELLRYYSPIAASCQHLYFFLTTIALLAAIDKTAKDRLHHWNGRGARQIIIDALLLLCYLFAFVFSIACARTDELLSYGADRIPGWYEEEPLSSKFKAQLAQWNAFNVLRQVGSVLGWLLISAEARAYQFDGSNKRSYMASTTHRETS